MKPNMNYTEQAQKMLPKEKDNGFDNDVYCRSCRLSETFCQCEGFNQAIKECIPVVAQLLEERDKDNKKIVELQAKLKERIK